MVFFSAQKDEPPTTTTRYRFVAALRVEARITHTNIFEGGSARLYRDYLNLLIRPSGDGWEHFEPGLHPSQWHDDWMWRLCARRGLRKADVATSGRRHQPGDLLTLGTRPLPIADSYVIFSTSTSVIVPDPPLVAAHRRGDAAERWQADDRSNMIRELVFGASPRGLRTGNPQQPHRHFRRTLVDQGWPESLRRALSS